MLNYQQEIDQLTIEQKVAILANAQTGMSEEHHIPSLSVAPLWSHNVTPEGAAIYPSAQALANAWSPELFTDVAEHLAALGMQRGTNLFVLPDPKAAFSLYGPELSEDPVLTAACVSAAAVGLSKNNCKICLPAPVLTETDVRALHGEVDVRTIYARTALPFQRAIAATSCNAVLHTEQPAGEKYSEVSAQMVKEAVPQIAMQITPNAKEKSVLELQAGRALLAGSEEVIMTAVENYKRIKKAVEDGCSVVDELTQAEQEGLAISEESIDKLLDYYIGVCRYCSDSQIPPEQQGAWIARQMETLFDSALQAAKRSTVLLRNEGQFLPLRQKAKYAFFGDVISDKEGVGFRGFRDQFAAAMSKNGHICCGYAPGYQLETQESEAWLGEAVALAQKSDLLVVFLGQGRVREAELAQTRNLCLPANQIALYDALQKTGKPILLVVVGSRLPDMSFDASAKSILLIPGEGIGVAQATADVINGGYAPSGRLAYAGYHLPDEDFRESDKQKREGKQKTGPFIGYRRAVSERILQKYAFGFGLTYSSFSYRGEMRNQTGLRLTVKNMGSVAASTVVQLYVSKPDSALLRPAAELIAFERVYLRPGEQRDMKISVPSLAVYDPDSKQMVTEAGGYEIYVAESAEKVVMRGQVTVLGTKLPPQKVQKSDYLRIVSNILTKSYMMEAPCKPMKDRKKKQNVGILIALFSLFLTVIYATCGYATFFQTYNWVCLIGIGIAAFGLGFYAWNFKQEQKEKHQQKEQEIAATEQLFQDAEVVHVDQIHQLFVDAFDIPARAQAGEAMFAEEEQDETMYAHINVDTTLGSVAKELQQFLAESGHLLDFNQTRKLLSSILSSRLLIVRTQDQQKFYTLMGALGEYFATNASVTSLQGANAGVAPSLLCIPKGYEQDTTMYNAISMAKFTAEKPHFIGVADLPFADMGRYLTPYLRYFSNPRSKYVVTEQAISLELPKNLWFMVCAIPGDSLTALEPYVSNFATVLDLDFAYGEIAPQKSQWKVLSYPQMEALVYHSKRAMQSNEKGKQQYEDFWKCIDRVELYVQERLEDLRTNGVLQEALTYQIGNKQSLQLERYISVYLESEGQIGQAMDSAATGMLLPAILTLLKQSKEGEDLLQVLESVFGSDNIDCCNHLIKHAYTQIQYAAPAQVPEDGGQYVMQEQQPAGGVYNVE